MKGLDAFAAFWNTTVTELVAVMLLKKGMVV